MGSFLFVFGRGSVDSKKMGKIYSKQMYLDCNKTWLLRRISPICENCSKNNYYNIYKMAQTEVAMLERKEIIYKIICPDCNETIELDFEEYYIVEPIIKLNKKFEEGKIDENKFNKKIEKIKLKYLK